VINFYLQEDGSAKITKKALVFVEGVHTDSQKRKHDFGYARVLQIVQNTNEKISQGFRVPFQQDHKKTQDFNLGDIDGEFYTKVITEKDLPNPKHRHLLGKLGVFVDSIIVKSKQAIQQVIEGGIKTISAGIDPDTESFIEVSATPFPAILGPALFSQGENEVSILKFSEDSDLEEGMTPKMKKSNSKVFSMEEALGLGKEEDSIHEEYEVVSQALYQVLISLYKADEAELKGLNPIENSYNAIEFFVQNVEDIFGLTMSDEEESGDMSGIKGSDIPGYNKKQMGFSKSFGKDISKKEKSIQKNKKYVRF